MSKRSHCQACTNIRFGVRTRIHVPHSCQKTYKEILDMMKHYKENPIVPFNKIGNQ